MKKAELNGLLRGYVRLHVSPTLAERALVSKLYAAVREALGQNCYLIGSYARFTASRPMHDIDVLFVAGDFNPNQLDPRKILSALHEQLDKKFKNPTNFRLEISQQTHSITICFLEDKTERYAIDVVPALRSGAKNEFGDDIFWVPEILTVSKRNRPTEYGRLEKRNKKEVEWWIKSDPRGYISAATNLNEACPDFRKVTKLIKKWKHNCKQANGTLELKSFHVEQAITEIVRRNPTAEIFDIFFEFFFNLPSYISRPQIADRADASKFIDQYVANLTEPQRQTILQARDYLLIQLEGISERSSVSSIISGGVYTRAGNRESFLFDQNIPMLIEPEASMRIVARVRARDGFRSGTLDAAGHVDVNRHIDFSADFRAPYNVDLLKWKVKNDNASPEPRGEITDHTPRNNPERTQYRGAHLVECFAISKGRCVARAKQHVVLRVV